jgi:hypothetical protein
MRSVVASTAFLSLTLLLGGCQPPTRGKNYLKAHPQELADILRACADGTHRNPQECSNAESVKTLDQKLRSLSKPD